MVQLDILRIRILQMEVTKLQKQSSKKTFTSISVMAQIEDPDAVIAIYRKAQQIKGLITL